MKKILLIIGLIIFVSVNSESQIQPSITYDSLSGDYIIRYQGTQGIIEEYFVPATKINPIVNAIVEKRYDTLCYSYKIINHVGSRQRLLNFRLSILSNIFDVSRPNEQWSSKSAGLVHGWYWGHTLVNPDGGPSEHMGIPTDSTVSGFSFCSFGLPTIVNSYFQGLTGTMTF